MTRASPESGQASVELVAVIPFVILAALVVWQIVLAGHTLWLTAGAARSAARADTDRALVVARNARSQGIPNPDPTVDRYLRSLSPEHPAFHPTYGGDIWARDGGYHQGPVWAWLLAWLAWRAGIRRFTGAGG